MGERLREPVIIHSTQHIPWQRRYTKAFISGFQRRGMKAGFCSDRSALKYHTGTPIIFGPNVFRDAFAEYRSLGIDVLTVNRAFMGDVLGDQPDPYVAIGWNGYNNLAKFPFKLGNRLPWSRVQPEFYIRDPKPRQGPVLILGEHKTPPDFVRSAIRDAESSGLGYWFRPHPNGDQPRRAPACPKLDLRAALEESAIVLTHHSTAGVEALLCGLPTIAYDPESMCWPICPHGPIGDVMPRHVPDRRAWIEWLAWTQWKISEIEAGDPWDFFIDAAASSDAVEDPPASKAHPKID